MFEDFNKLLEAANETVAAMQEESNLMSKEIRRREDDKWAPIYDFFCEVADMTSKVGKDTMFKSPISFGSGICDTYFRVAWITGPFPEIGISVDCFNNGKPEFIRWFDISRSYCETKHPSDSRWRLFAEKMYENWDSYAPLFEVAIKDGITKAMAEKIDKVRAEVAAKAETLNNL